MNHDNTQDTTVDSKEIFQKQLEEATKLYVAAMTEHTPMNEAERDNMKDSSNRMAKALCDMVLPKNIMIDQLHHILKDDFPITQVTGMKNTSNKTPVLLSEYPIQSSSLCPHHFLPVQYEVFIAILIKDEDNNSVVYGLSKYTRAVQAMAKRPVIQEQYTRDIVEVFTNSLLGGTEVLTTKKVAGCMAIVEGVHGCMTCRGVRSLTPTVTHYSIGLDQQQEQRAWSLYNGYKK